MHKVINIKVPEHAIEALEYYKSKKTRLMDIRLSNTELKTINKLTGINLFSKNDLFVGSDTLYEIMQPVGGKDRHNYHGLTPKELVEVFNNLINPYCVFFTDLGRLGIISTIISESGHPLMVVIEIGAGLISNSDANINKMLTMYPKDKLNKYLGSSKVKKVLYTNQKLNPEK